MQVRADNNIKRGGHIYFDANVENKAVEFLLDSGAAACILSNSTFQKLTGPFEDATLKVELQDHQGHPIPQLTGP